MSPSDAPAIRFGTAQARWVLAATVLGSGVAFLDGTVVNVALPAISADLGTSLTGLQWTVNAYLVTLSALLLLGGSLGDRFGRRRMFVMGLVGFTVASLLCGIAPSSGFLIAARAIQGVGGAMLVPGSLSIIAATFHHDDRGRAIGAWSGLAGVASSVGPFLGGWLIDSLSWRLIFLINVPIAATAIAIALRHVPETRASTKRPLDLVGAALITVALAFISYAAIKHSGMVSAVSAAIGLAAIISFVFVERTSSHPMLPLRIFRSRQFSGTNLTTLAVYAGLGGALFLLVLRLQISLGYSALESGAALVPFTVLMLLISPAAGQLGQRIGARLPMTLGPILAGAGMLLLSGVAPGDTYLPGVLPGIVVFGLGMALTVAPLTAAVLASVGDEMTGVASGVNNAVARLAGLLAVAALPALAGISTGESMAIGLNEGFARALRISAAVTAAGGVIAALVVRATSKVRPAPQPSVYSACQDPALAAR
ncbi:MAG: DHA2 family efflux MFS transporter permease subunit, partial [Acidimicrobiales bacterium]